LGARIVRLVAIFGLCVLTCACTASEVTEAYCNACGGRVYSDADCRAWGDEAGCEAVSFVPEVGGDCENGCTFRDCKRSPHCGPREQPAPDASGAEADDDAAVTLPAATCELADDRGLFDECVACENCVMFKFNGLTRYACSCGEGCPCGFQCGSIALPAGAELGGVCTAE
jgi:hypothetical protein